MILYTKYDHKIKKPQGIKYLEKKKNMNVFMVFYLHECFNPGIISKVF